MEERAGSPDPQQTELYLVNPNNPDRATRVKGSQELGGELGALFHYRDKVLGPNLSDMGKTAIAIADAYNQIQQQGVDLNGEPGQNFFNDINSPQAQANRFLSSNPDIKGAVEITDTGKLTGGEYTLKFQPNGNYMLTDINSGTKTVIEAADVIEGSNGEQIIDVAIETLSDSTCELLSANDGISNFLSIKWATGSEMPFPSLPIIMIPFLFSEVSYIFSPSRNVP